MNDNQKTFLFIPHTHWEGAVFKTREEYLELGLPNILRALKLLQEYPDYRFVLDQICYVKPFLERYPEHENTFRKFIAEGRLAIVGATDVMLDVNMPGGESYIRQVLLGKGYYRQKLGVEVTVGWQLDTFGHHAQMPQFLKLAGYRSLWFFRGVSDWNVPSEFFWEGIDGSQVAAYWLPLGYANVWNAPKTLPEFSQFMRDRYNELEPFSRASTVRLGLAGADVCEPEDFIPPLVEAFNRQPDAPFSLRLAVPADYEKAVDERSTPRPTVRGEMNPIFQGIYSSRIELKQRTRELEGLLTTAEKLGVVARGLGFPADDSILWRAWEPMLFNQAHDLMSGVMTDHVYEDTLRGYDFSRRIAEEEVDARLHYVIDSIDTRGEGAAMVVFNSLGWQRTDVVVANVGFNDGSVMDIAVVDPEGHRLPVQILEAERYTSGGLVRARIAFIARDIPALGYAVYRVLGISSASSSPTGTPSVQANACLENEYYRLEVDPTSGAITRLVVKDGNWEALNAAGNVVAMQEDHGDLWEPYHSLDGGSRIAMKDRHEPPPAGSAVFSTDQTGTPGTVIQGAVCSELTVTHPFSEKGTFQTTVRLYAGLRRLEIHTQILNHDRFVRYRVLFPTTISQGQNIHEIPFGAIERQDGIEFPAQNWSDTADKTKGIALLNRGLPGNNTANGTMMLSLLRTTCIVAYGFGGGYEPGMSSDSGFELGQILGFDYALLPHSGNWQQAGVYRDGMEFNQPLLARTAASHPGKLPKKWGLLQISHPNILVSTLKSSEDGTRNAVLRIYEAGGQPAQGVQIKLSVPVLSAEEVNLMEDAGQKLKVTGNLIQLDFKPFEIKTIKLQL